MVESILGHELFKELHFWKALLAEFIGTFFLVLIGAGAVTATQGINAEIALTFGIVVGIMVQLTAHISGGHINPAVTLAMLVTRKISIIKGILYIICQLLGSMCGAGLLMGVTPSSLRGDLGVTDLHSDLKVYQGLVIEISITFVLVFTVFSVTDPSRSYLQSSAPMLIGLSVLVCHLWAIPYTGASMNTARSFGPAVIMNSWKDHWVYWVGPLLGGVLAGLLYMLLFSSEPFPFKRTGEKIESEAEEVEA